MAGARVAAGGVDLLEDRARSRQPEACAAVLLRDERRQPAGLGQGADELLGVAVGLERPPVLPGEVGAEFADGRADLRELGRLLEVHVERLRSRRAMMSCWISFEPSPIRSSGASR